MPFVIGLTGGIASGKSALASALQALGAGHIDTDHIAREVTGPNGAAMAEIRAVFGAAVIAGDGSLDRAVMREKAFADLAARARLESIVHPHIGQSVVRELAFATADVAPYVVLSVPLLFESQRMLKHCARTLVVDVTTESQRARLLTRPGISASLADQILAAQLSRVDRLSRADDCVANVGDLGLLALSARVLDRRYRRYAAHASGGSGLQAER